MPKGKYYVVWKGLNPGIYDSWEACRLQVEGQENAKYKSFLSREEAVEAFEKGHRGYLRKATVPPAATAWGPVAPAGKPVMESLSVDAACSGNPGDMEYRGVYTATGEEIFRLGPFRQGTNNVGEFLALVHGLALLKQNNSHLPVYSDSVNAIKWVKNKKCKTLLERTPANEPIFDLIERAEKWLKGNTYTTPILKWETSRWGEIPADFGRK
ncbi:MAG: viroplasmin family protein [Tannerellaceae bacterium]|jgi:ribonuclease HI|nr:viroplasmin family protein [Tannerellaceae bacterium]